jgi:hypothetical protein
MYRRSKPLWKVLTSALPRQGVEMVCEYDLHTRQVCAPDSSRARSEDAVQLAQGDAYGCRTSLVRVWKEHRTWATFTVGHSNA